MKARPRRIHRDGYSVEVYTTPKGLYVQRGFATHGCLVTWGDMRRALKRHDAKEARETMRVEIDGKVFHHVKSIREDVKGSIAMTDDRGQGFGFVLPKTLAIRAQRDKRKKRDGWR